MLMKFRIALPGTHHIPAADDHVPEAAQWTTKLQAPEFRRILGAIDELQYDAVTRFWHGDSDRSIAPTPLRHVVAAVHP
jgi:hypothetical protein